MSNLTKEDLKNYYNFNETLKLTNNAYNKIKYHEKSNKKTLYENIRGKVS